MSSKTGREVGKKVDRKGNLAGSTPCPGEKLGFHSGSGRFPKTFSEATPLPFRDLILYL
ncbi:hypothetical protein F2Q69_00042317 [Brassica cretica]|uniref:Uncharacterized protein n=1 Tax=Brassica cretica TaxID=69181 RepID=A0A8S9NNZ3_BRACR|nr:hypothetical protein F2Q69_00042317 [Brassica cretica]